jgi:hypothetical protein
MAAAASSGGLPEIVAPEQERPQSGNRILQRLTGNLRAPHADEALHVGSGEGLESLTRPKPLSRKSATVVV